MFQFLRQARRTVCQLTSLSRRGCGLSFDRIFSRYILKFKLPHLTQTLLTSNVIHAVEVGNSAKGAVEGSSSPLNSDMLRSIYHSSKVNCNFIQKIKNKIKCRVILLVSYDAQGSGDSTYSKTKLSRVSIKHAVYVQTNGEKDANKDYIDENLS